MKYSRVDTSMLDLENADVTKVINARINDNTMNRADRRKIMKALGKMQNREKYFAKKESQTTKQLHEKYQKELDARIDDAKTQVNEGITDNWKKSVAITALTLKRKYNWNTGRVQSFIEKMNDLHVEMLKSGEWDNVLQVLSDECDIELEVSDQ